MSFLFGKKKQTHNPLPPATRETHTSGGTGTTSSIPTANGTRGKDRGPGGAQSPPPGPQPGFLPGPASGSNVNSSLNSISEGKTPSPDHGLDQRGGMEQDASVCTLISIEMRCCTRSEAFASSTWLYMGLLTNGIACSLLGQAQTELVHWTGALPRFIHGPNDVSRSRQVSQIRFLDMAQLSMRFRQRKGMCI